MLEGPDQKAASDHHPLSHSLIRPLITRSSLHVHDEITHIIGHLRGGGRGTIIIVEDTIDQLAGHTNDHMIEIGVEVLSLGHINAIGCLIVVASEDVVNVVNASRPETDLREVSGPGTTVRVLGLIN